MKQIGNIKLPLQRVERIKGTDQEILDVLFDLNVPNMNEALHALHEKDTPMLLALAVKNVGVGLLQYRPPDIWIDFDDQLYHLYMAPNIPILHHYFVDRRMRTHDIFESTVLTQIISWLEHFQQSQTVSHT